MQQTNNDWSEVPNDVWDALARAILEEIQALAATDEGQGEFAEWKKNRVHKTDTSITKVQDAKSCTFFMP